MIMFECIASWILLLIGIISGNPQWFIASGLFAVATQIRRLVGKNK